MLYQQLSHNVRRSWVLVTGFVIVVAGMGFLFGNIFGGGPAGLIVAMAISLVMSLLSYRSGDRMVLAMSHAKEVSQAEQPRLHNLVEGLAIAAGIPKPRIYVVEDPAPNAFATGRDPAHSSIAVTTGLLEKMNRVELEGVIGHELSHIRNRDTLVMAIVATLVGVLVLLADWTLRGLFWGGMGGRNRRGSDSAGAIFAALGLVVALLMPLMASVMQMAVSRRREFYADVQGVHLTRYPPGLISALEKLKADQTVVRTAVRATGHLWIESPLQQQSGFMGKLNKMFDTHPPLDERIRILREL
jgi:heat shock protein HtpX